MGSLRRYLAYIFALLILAQLAASQTECDSKKLCATGCCSKWGHCGTGDEFCGKGCQSTCDYKLGCDKKNPCKDGTCCNKFGFCGLGPDYCGTDCVGGCEAKSYCDPGYGEEWSEIGKCPLNVCCSKWGFCGLTEDFCGKKKVKRPSCSSNGKTIKRVVGYYEGWASGRPCDKRSPQDIPQGVYTHLNFAFASIDPSTYEIVPAARNDPQLYRQLTGLKKTDSNLKVYIALGGWTFNDEGQSTRKTFSELAASETRQKSFILSLISFINTYDFDGVDIDWEYPEAEDRGGLGKDYQNFPTFVRNVKSALRSNGQKNGLTITLPASYWYMRHFDIKKLEPHVDWFNIMTYDLHGTWDKPTSWLGNHLNAHTNLTEIADGIDLLWRNEIEPSKVVMGTAFYSRTFTVSDSSCMSKGCLFNSGGPPGRCSGTIGVLTNSEISRSMSQQKASSTLDQEAAVKIWKDGSDWITYDDEDTFKLKLDFARSQCMGGVMVWAVSQDTAEGKYSKALQKATGYTSPSVHQWSPGGVFMEMQGIKHAQDQCRWTNCGEFCPVGWSRVQENRPRTDAQIGSMRDQGGCGVSGGYRTFCCPPGPMPDCRWQVDFLGGIAGQCMNKCTAPGSFEIASDDSLCANGLSMLACCKSTGQKKDDHNKNWDTPVESMQIWDKCRWRGTSPDCKGPTSLAVAKQDCSKESGGRSDPLVLAELGSGATQCHAGYAQFRLDYSQLLCCTEATEDSRWENCFWSGRSNFGFGASTDACTSDCPPEFTKVAAKSGCKTGKQSFCCQAKVMSTSTENNAQANAVANLLGSWAENPICLSQSGRALTLLNRRDELQVRISDRDVILPTLRAKQVAAAILAASSLRKIPQRMLDDWNKKVVSIYRYLTPGNIKSMFTPTAFLQTIFLNDVDNAVWSLICDPQGWDEYIHKNGTKAKCPCDVNAFHKIDPDVLKDPDDGGEHFSTSFGEQEFQFLANLIRGKVLISRQGRSRMFTIPIGPNQVARLESVPYKNGDNGNTLATANQDSNRYVLRINPDDCFDAELVANGTSDVPVHAEHIVEQQTMASFIEFVAMGQLPAVNASSRDPVLFRPLRNGFGAQGSTIVTDYLNQPFDEWTRVYGQGSTPVTALFNALGSVANPSVMVNTQGSINGMKSRVWGMRRPIGEDNWNDYMAGPGLAAFEIALTGLNEVLGVFQYMRHSDVASRRIRVTNAVSRILRDFDRLYSVQYFNDNGRSPATGSLQAQWRAFMQNQLTRIYTYSRDWTLRHINEMETTWTGVLRELQAQSHLHAPNSPEASAHNADIANAIGNLENLEDLKARTEDFMNL